MRISPLVLAFLLAMTSGVQAQDQSVEPTDVKSAPKSAPKSAAKSAQEVEPKSAVESSDADKAAVDKAAVDKAAADKAAEEKRAAEEKEAAEAAESDVAKAVRAELFEQAKSYKFQSTANVHEPVDLKLIERSVLNWTNPIRHADTGIVVIWEDEGVILRTNKRCQRRMEFGLFAQLVAGTMPLFLIENSDTDQQVVTTDPYIFVPQEKLDLQFPAAHPFSKYRNSVTFSRALETLVSLSKLR